MNKILDIISLSGYCGTGKKRIKICNWYWLLESITISFWRIAFSSNLNIMLSAWGEYKHGGQTFQDLSTTLFFYIGIILSSIMDGKNQSAWQVVHARVWRTCNVSVTVANKTTTVRGLISDHFWCWKKLTWK